MNNQRQFTKPNFLWTKEHIDEIVSSINCRGAVKSNKKHKVEIDMDEIRLRIRFVLLKFSNPYSRNKKSILRKYIIAFPDNHITLPTSQIIKISKNVPEGNVRDALRVVLLNVFSKSEDRLYNYIRNRLIDSGTIEGSKTIVAYRGGGIDTKCNASSRGKRTQFIGLSGGRGIEVPKNPILR